LDIFNNSLYRDLIDCTLNTCKSLILFYKYQLGFFLYLAAHILHIFASIEDIK
jgi:hypothetical protein